MYKYYVILYKELSISEFGYLLGVLEPVPHRCQEAVNHILLSVCLLMCVWVVFQFGAITKKADMDTHIQGLYGHRFSKLTVHLWCFDPKTSLILERLSILRLANAYK
jgi:hypothetical protein